MNIKRLTALLMTILLMLPLCAAQAEERVMLRCGGSFILAIDARGKVWGWGDNTKGQIGKQDKAYYRHPVQAAEGLNGDDILDIQCGNENTLYLMKDGTVYTSGTGSHGTQGLGREVTGTVGAPRQIPGLKNIVQISCGFGHNAVLDQDGHVWTWGRNHAGQLGNQTKTESAVPVMLELENIVQVTCGGKFCLALDADGKVWGWGANTYGVISNKRKVKQVTKPIEVAALKDIQVKELAGGSDCGFALDTDGVLWAWGRNDYSQVGTSQVKGTDIYSAARVELPEGTVVRRIIGYSSHVMCITDKDEVYIWGSVSAGQMGIGTAPMKTFPMLCYSGEKILDADIGSLICAILTEDGTIRVSGYNKYGQLGNGTAKSTRTWSAENGLNLFTGIVAQ